MDALLDNLKLVLKLFDRTQKGYFFAFGGFVYLAFSIFNQVGELTEGLNQGVISNIVLFADTFPVVLFADSLKPLVLLIVGHAHPGQQGRFMQTEFLVLYLLEDGGVLEQGQAGIHVAFALVD